MAANLRVTRQYTEVLGAGDGQARVTRQYIEVLASANIQEWSGGSDLGLDQAADEWVSPGALHSLGLGQTLTATADRAVTVVQDLGLEQPLLIGGPVYIDIRHSLGLDDIGGGHAGVVNLSAINALALSQVAGRVLSVSVTSVLNLSVIGEKRNTASSILALSQVVSAGKGVDVESALVLSQTAHPGLILNRSILHPLALLQSVTYYVVGSRRFDRQYSPFVGVGPGGAPSVTLSGPMDAVPLQLVWPAVGVVTDSVTLRAPNLGNKDRLGFQRINRETRGGTLVVFADPIWPKTQTLVLTFSGMTRSEAQDYLDFCSDHFGVEIGLIDWESRYWRGIITTMESVTEDSPNYFSFGFEFEGEMAD